MMVPPVPQLRRLADPKTLVYGVPILCLIAGLTIFAYHALKPISDALTWSDGRTRVDFRVTYGRVFDVKATIAIQNLTDQPQTHKKPEVMPQCGDTFKNNIRVFDANDNELDMTGIHADYMWPPTVEIPPRSRRSWTFCLNDYFPALAEPGTYSVLLWYPYGARRVDMAAIVIEIER